MLQKKALFLVTTENEVQPLINFAKIFKQKYSVDVDVLYIKDVLKYEVFPVSIEGMGLNIGANYAFKEYRELEEKTVKKLKEKMTDDISNFYTKDGETSEIVLEELKKYDLLVLVKNEKVTSVLKEILRSIFKPLIILPNMENFKLDNLMLLDDGAYNANKTLFTFFHIFGEQKVDVLRVNVEEDDENSLVERFGENYNLIHKKGDTFKTIMTRIGSNSKYIFLGDIEQIDRKNQSESCLAKVLNIFKESNVIGTIEFDDSDCVRNPIIPKILQRLREFGI